MLEKCIDLNAKKVEEKLHGEMTINKEIYIFSSFFLFFGGQSLSKRSGMTSTIECMI